MNDSLSQKLSRLASYLKKEGLADASVQTEGLIEVSPAYVKRLQKALTEAGFLLPEFGIDGKLGRETKKAVIDFKQKAKAEGLYAGEVDEKVSLDLIKIIESFGSPEGSQDTKEEFTLFVGDSQMKGRLGKALISKAKGKVEVVAKRSTKPSYWAKNSQFKRLLKKGPSKIVISLNGNGNAGASSLIQTILELTGDDVPVLWTGAPPPIYRPRSYLKKVTTPKGWYKHFLERKQWNEEVKSMMPNDLWVFVDPYDHIKYDNPRNTKGYTVSAGYYCKGCDGVHLPKDVANQYASQIASYV